MESSERTDRCQLALNAMTCDAFPGLLEWVAKALDERRGKGAVEYMNVLLMLSDPVADAVHVIAYAGRDEYRAGNPYAPHAVGTEFSEWWDYLSMENECYVRGQIAEKVPLPDYIRKGAYMFGIGNEVGA